MNKFPDSIEKIMETRFPKEYKLCTVYLSVQQEVIPTSSADKEGQCLKVLHTLQLLRVFLTDSVRRSTTVALKHSPVLSTVHCRNRT